MGKIVQNIKSNTPQATGLGHDFGADVSAAVGGTYEERLRGRDSVPVQSGMVTVKQGTLTPSDPSTDTASADAAKAAADAKAKADAEAAAAKGNS